MTPKKIISISLALLNLLSPLSVLAQARSGAPFQAPPVPAVCRKIGVNFAVHYAVDDAYYEMADSVFGMGWTLAIANKSDPGSTIAGLNSAISRGLKPIVRIGVGTDDGGFFNPTDYVAFLNQIADQVNGPFYAVAGPNEPDSERWLDHNIPQYNPGDETPVSRRRIGDINYAGQLLANYMNTVINSNLDRGKVKLLSPSINLSSWTGGYFIDGMIAAGANFSGLDAFSGTSYSGSGGVGDILIQIAKVTSRLPNLPIVLTEYHDGDGNQDLITLKAIIDEAKRNPSVTGAAIFNAFNTNTGWSQFALTDTELAQVLGPECVNLTELNKITRPKPRPSMRPCTTEDSPEFHPLRPYPGEPCDPLIPRSKPAANYPIDAHSGLPLNIPLPKDEFSTQLAKDYQLRNSVAFACGKSLTPNTPEQFDAALGKPREFPDGRGKCELSGNNHVTCYIKEKFDLMLDLTDANIPILGNTQTGGMTDAQKMTEYLSWFLNGTVQQSEQNPNPSISRLINFSGPLQKLLPFDLKNWDRSELVKGPAGIPFDVNDPDSGQYHNYIVGCKKAVNLDYILQAIKDWFDTLVSAIKFTGELAWKIPQLIFKIPKLSQDIYSIITSRQETSHRLAETLKTLQFTDIFEVQSIISDSGFPELAADLAFLGSFGSGYLKNLGEFIDSLNLDVAVTCMKEDDDFKRLKDFRGLNVAGIDNLPPDPTKYDNFGKYWADYTNWRGFVNVPLLGAQNLPGIFDPFNGFNFINGNVWSQLFQNISFSSLEDATGEVVISVSDNYKHANMQDKDVVEGNTHPIDNATLKLIIKPKP